MDLNFLIFLILVSFAGGMASGIFAVGGAIILIPALTFLPPILNLPVLPMHLVTGLASVQSMVASLSTLIAKTKYNSDMKPNIWLPMSVGTSLGGFAGGVSANFLQKNVLLGIYFILLLLSVYSLLQKYNGENSSPNIFLHQYTGFKLVWMVLIGLMIGFPSGALGIGGGILISPALYYMTKAPMKPVMANTIVVVFILALSSFTGKILTHQIDWLYGIIIGCVAFWGAKVGTVVHNKLPDHLLRQSLIVLLSVTACYTFFDLMK